jgi:hypothetical protein
MQSELLREYVCVEIDTCENQGLGAKLTVKIEKNHMFDSLQNDKDTEPDLYLILLY